MLITPALAQTAAPAPGGGDFFIQLVPFILIFVIMYFLIIRPQQKRLKEHREMIASIRRGDVVVTAGGIIGKVVRLTGDSELKVEIADGIQVRVIRSTITEVRTKTEPVRERARVEDDEDEDGDEDTYIEEREEPKPRSQPKRVAQAATEPARKTGPAPLAPRKPATKAARSKARGKTDTASEPVRAVKSPAAPAEDADDAVARMGSAARPAPAAPDANGEDTSGNAKRGNA